MYMILSEFIYGGMDGVITTVAIIAGILGANIAPKYALVLGLASLFADGFSMGISRYSSLVQVLRLAGQGHWWMFGAPKYPRCFRVSPHLSLL